MHFGGAQGSNPADAAIAAVSSVVVPKLKDLQVQLETLVQQGQLSPAQYQTFLQDISAYDNMPSTPEGRNQQLKALTDLNDIIDAPGLNAIDKAKLAQVRAASAQAEQGQRGAILTNAQERGVGGSGLELQSQLLNTQEAANRESAAGTQVAADAATARQAAIDKMMTGGNNLAAQDFSQASTKAAAQNAINQFNAAQKTATSNANVSTENAAQAANLAEKQRIADTNTAIKNQEQAANAAAVEQDFQNRFSKASGVASQYQNQVNLQQAQSAQQEKNIMGGVSTVAGVGATLLSDEKAKTDIHEADMSKILDELTGYTYKYKKPEKYGAGKQTGVMAQDVEKVLPQAVHEGTDGLKRIDTAKLSGPILAALSSIHERLKTVEEKK